MKNPIPIAAAAFFFFFFFFTIASNLAMETLSYYHETQQYYTHLSFLTSFRLRPTSQPSALRPLSSVKIPRLIHLTSSSLHNNNSETHSDDHLSRTHNAKASALLRHLSPNPQQQNSNSQIPERKESPISKEDKIKLLEMSLITKRTPQFPGSVCFQSDATASSSSSTPIQAIFQGASLAKIDDDDEEDEMLMKAIEIRRKVTVEILKQAMRKGKFGITYYTSLISKMPDFVDYVMIEAASKKQLPEFSQSSFNVRARVFIDDSGVVPLIRWLKHNSLSYPQIAKLICMSKGNLSSIRCLVEWLKTIYVKGRCIGVALTRGGDNILQRSVEELDDIIGYLESNGVRIDWMGFVVSRCPEILSFNMEEIKSRVSFFVDMGMDEKDFGSMVFDFPKVLGYYSMEEMEQKVAFLKEFDLSNEEVGRLLAFKPHLLACSIEERWKPLVKYFYYLGISKEGMRRILTIKPMVFCIDLESSIVPKVQFFRDIGVKEDSIGGMLTRFPPLMTYSLNKKIRPVVVFLLTKAGVNQRDIGKVVALAPELLGCNIANKLDPNVKYFLSLGIHLRKLGEMIADFPMLLRYNTDILHPKYRYLRRTMIRPLLDLIEFPRFFSYSLEDRIIPRHKIMLENRINFKLRYMLTDTDEEFDQRVNAALERRRRFKLGLKGEQTDLSESQTTNGGIDNITVDPATNSSLSGVHFPSSDSSTIHASTL